MLLRILCILIDTSSLWVVFVNKNRCISVPLVSEKDKASKFDNFDNPHNSFLWPEYFIDYFCKNWFHVRLWHPSLVFFPPKDSLLQHKKCVHLWNNFPCISSLQKPKWKTLIVSQKNCPKCFIDVSLKFNHRGANIFFIKKKKKIQSNFR